jgi:hypothetical protein
MDKGDPQAIRARVRALQEEIAQIHAANRLYRKELFHHPFDVQAHNKQILRLEEILRELASVSRESIPRKEARPKTMDGV